MFLLYVVIARDMKNNSFNSLQISINTKMIILFYAIVMYPFLNL